MNLLTSNFQKSVIFSKLPRFESVVYKGELKPKIQHFEVLREGETIHLIVEVLIRKEEGFVWKSFFDLMSHALKIAEAGMQGFFGFDLISLDFSQGINHFHPNELAQLIVNHSRKLALGDEVLIQYGSIFGLLKKRIQEQWGKIDFHSPVEICTRGPEQFDLEVKRLIRESEGLSGSRIIIIQDLSTDPIFKFGAEEQTARLRELLAKLASHVFDIYVIQKDNLVELRAQFGIIGQD